MYIENFGHSRNIKYHINIFLSMAIYGYIKNKAEISVWEKYYLLHKRLFQCGIDKTPQCFDNYHKNINSLLQSINLTCYDNIVIVHTALKKEYDEEFILNPKNTLRINEKIINIIIKKFHKKNKFGFDKQRKEKIRYYKDSDLNKEFDKVIEDFIRIETLYNVLGKTLKYQVKNNKIKKNKFEEEFISVLTTSYQEFYHAFSHLYFSSEEVNNRETIRYAKSHLQRAKLDFVKKGVDLINKYTYRYKMNLIPRLKEINIISNSKKNNVINMYEDEIKKYLKKYSAEQKNILKTSLTTPHQ